MLSVAVGPGCGISQEPEGIITALYQHLLSFQDAVLSSLDPHALAVIFSPLCTVIPRLLLRYVQHIALSSTENNEENSYAMDSSVSLAEQIHHDKTHILRSMVACQQSLGLLIENSHFPPATTNRLQDIMGEEFERVRRYVTLMDMPMSELKQYISLNFNDYTYAEYCALWTQLKDKPQEVSFDQMWNSILTRKSLVTSTSNG